MRKEEDPGSPAMLLEDLDQAWMVWIGLCYRVISSLLSGEVLPIRAFFPTSVVSLNAYVT